MPSAIVIGGSGQIGIATAKLFTSAGWNVTTIGRSSTAPIANCPHLNLDRNDTAALHKALHKGADLVLDCIAFEANHADQLISLQSNIGRLCVISSASVYRDQNNCTLDEASETGQFPDFPIPIPEDHPTIAAGLQNYSTKKVAIEQLLLQSAKVPVTILRPCAIHGPHSNHAREWWFVKRLLDDRKRIPLAYCGRSQLQTTSVEAIAKAVMFATNTTASNIFNVIDGNAPSAADIGRAIMKQLNRNAELVGLPHSPVYQPPFGFSPWSIQKPMVCASSLPQTKSYADAVTPAVEWLLKEVNNDNWQTKLPQLAGYPKPQFDYAADDEALELAGTEVLM